VHQKAQIELSASVHLQKEIHAYLLKPVQEKNTSRSQQNQRIHAIKFYDEKVPGREKTCYGIDRPRRERKLPDVLSRGLTFGIFRSGWDMVASKQRSDILRFQKNFNFKNPIDEIID